MRIPSEALALYRPDGSRAFVDRDGTRPVAGSARIASVLPKFLPQRPLADATEGERDDADAATLGRREHRRENRRQHGEESGKRQDDRRKESYPVLIDTRLGRARRQSDPAIDVTV